MDVSIRNISSLSGSVDVVHVPSMGEDCDRLSVPAYVMVCSLELTATGKLWLCDFPPPGMRSSQAAAIWFLDI
jgi:hypothetical protein